jgi:hypothetical protein
VSRKRFLRFWGLLVLVMWTSGSAMAACPSSWYWYQDTSTIGDCGASTQYSFTKLLIGMFNGIATHMDIIYLNLLKLVRAIAQVGPVGHNF